MAQEDKSKEQEAVTSQEINDIDLNLDDLGLGDDFAAQDSSQGESSGNLSDEEKETLREDQTSSGNEEVENETDNSVTDESVAEDTGSVENTGETEDNGEDDDSGSTDDTLRLHAEALQERGVLPSDFDINSISGDTYEERLENQFNAIADAIHQEKEQYKQHLDSLTQEVSEMIESGVSEDEAKKRVSDRAKIEQLTDEQIEQSQELQEYVLRTLYGKKGYSEDDIEKIIKRSRDADALYEDAKEARQKLPELYKKEDKERVKQEQKKQEEREKKQQEVIQKVDERLDNVVGKELFPGLQVSERDKKQIRSYMLESQSYEKDQNGNSVPISKEQELLRQDPIGFKMKLNYLIHLGYFDKNADLSKIVKKQDSSATKRIAKRIKDSEKKGQKTPGKSKAQGVDNDDSGIPVMPEEVNKFK